MAARTAPRSRRFARAVSMAGAAALAFTLAACSNEQTESASGASTVGLEGDYYEENGRLSITGDEVIYATYECEDGTPVYEGEPRGVGQLTDDQSQVVWIDEDQQIGDPNQVDAGTSPIVLTEAGDLYVVTIDGDTEFRSEPDTNLADCAERAQKEQERAAEAATVIPIDDGEYFTELTGRPQGGNGIGKLTVTGDEVELELAWCGEDVETRTGVLSDAPETEMVSDKTVTWDDGSTERLVPIDDDTGVPPLDLSLVEDPDAEGESPEAKFGFWKSETFDSGIRSRVEAQCSTDFPL